MCLFFVMDTYVFFLHFRVNYLYKYLVVKRMGMCIDLSVLDVRKYFIGVGFYKCWQLLVQI